MFRMLSLALLNALLSLTSFDVIAAPNQENVGQKPRSVAATLRRHHYEPMLSFEGGHAHLRDEIG